MSFKQPSKPGPDPQAIYNMFKKNPPIDRPLNLLRYEIRNGKWGAFFYDNQDNRNLPLNDVCVLLNVFALLAGNKEKIGEEN